MTARGFGRRPAVVLLALLTCVVTVAGCASIPTESLPQAVPQENTGQPTQDIPEPELGLDPLSVVREFVRNSVRPANDHAASRAYLGRERRADWTPDPSVMVIEDEFGTVYAPETSQPENPNERVITLRGSRVGRLAPDSSFIAGSEEVRQRIRVRKQKDGEWRIVEPPDSIVITESDFTDAYQQVSVYFFSPDSTALVSDRRYVVARPQSGLPSRVIDLLLAGPSDALNGAVRNPLGEAAVLASNVTTSKDGALVVPLTGPGDVSEGERELMVAQIVRTLQHVTTSRVKLLSDGAALVPGQTEWRPSDLPVYDTVTSPSSELPGLMTVDGRLRSLGSGHAIEGPAGSGSYEIVSAAQAINGHQLAVVERVDNEVRLRIGDYGAAGEVVGEPAKKMSRPSWRPPASKDDKAAELWVVADGERVTRIQRDAHGKWVTERVNSADIAGDITGLRLSRDGTRAALIVDGRLLVASVVRSPTQATLRAPRVLQQERLDSVVDVDWLNQDTLVVATSSDRIPVVRVSVDGFQIDQYNSSNLTPPMRAITAAPGRPIVVADAGGLWTASEIGAVWRPHAGTRPGAEPFYPG